MTFIDIVIGMLLIGFMIAGYKSGFVKKIIGIMCLVGALIIATKYSADLHQMIFEDMGISGRIGFIISFIIIVVVITLTQSLIYKIFFKKMFDALWNKILGLFLGLLEGTLVLSIMLIVISIYLNLPSQETKGSSQLYKPVKNFAPLVFDQVNTFLPESEDFYFQIMNYASDQMKKLEKK